MVAAAVGTGLDLGQIVQQVAEEKGIDKAILIETMEAAILKAAQASFGPTRELEARFNSETGSIDLFQYMTVVEEVTDSEREIGLEIARTHGLDAEVGEDLGFQVFWHPRDAERARQQDKEFGAVLDMKQARSAFGRIAAQTAKQVLLQRVRDAERDLIFNEYKDRQGQLIRGIVRRFEKGHNVVVDLGRTEGMLPAREQTPRETYRPGDRIVAYVKNIDRESRGPMIILSRSAPQLVDRLFEAEVPEIYEGIVRIV
ncbi:MAG TPA: transcription termination/antitermination protein NusA, partial [Polyangiaceae bacterium]